MALDDKNRILCAGNFIRDHIKIVETYPAEGMLTSITEESSGTGGCAYNTLMNFAALDKELELHALGVVGDDDNGNFIIDDLQQWGVNTEKIRKTNEKPTSYTDVMTVKDTGNRTFFHNRGANALLDMPDFDTVTDWYSLIHIGYLLLLDKLDSPAGNGSTVAARVLKRLKEKGYKISVDVVSEAGDRFRNIVLPALPFIDFLVVNELEAAAITGLPLRNAQGKIIDISLPESAGILLRAGVCDSVVIHFPEGAFGMTKDGRKELIPSYHIEKTNVKGTTGAGDAFCSGFLYAQIKNMNLKTSLEFGNACGAFNLLDTSATGGAVSAEEIINFIAKDPPRNTLY